MKTDRNKNNVKSEENMILEKSRRSDANVFPVENKGKGKIAEAKKRQVKGVIWKTVLRNMMKNLNIGIVIVAISLMLASCGNRTEQNSSAAEMAVYGYCLGCSRRSGNGSYPAADPGKNRRYSHSGKSRDILGDFPLFCNACTYRIHGICQGRSAYRIRAENHTCT